MLTPRWVEMVRYYLATWWDIREESGLLRALRETIKKAAEPVYEHKQYYVYRKNLADTGLPRKLPDQYEMCVLDSANSLTNLIDAGYRFSPRLVELDGRRFLSVGCAGFMLFHNRRFVAEAWLLPTHYVTLFCPLLENENDLAFVGGVETLKPYRGNGLQHYLLGEVFNYARRGGATKADMVVNGYGVKSDLLWRSVGAVRYKTLTLRGVLGQRTWSERLEEPE